MNDAEIPALIRATFVNGQCITIERAKIKAIEYTLTSVQVATTNGRLLIPFANVSFIEEIREVPAIQPAKNIPDAIKP